jgi:hypothetical protein
VPTERANVPNISVIGTSPPCAVSTERIKFTHLRSYAFATYYQYEKLVKRQVIKR